MAAPDQSPKITDPLVTREPSIHGSSPLAQGQVEKNVRDSRHQMLQGMPDFPDLAALNDWLEQRCIALWHETAHGSLPGTIADIWAEELPLERHWSE